MIDRADLQADLQAEAFSVLLLRLPKNSARVLREGDSKKESNAWKGMICSQRI
jgi:hypothetical protein